MLHRRALGTAALATAVLPALPRPALSQGAAYYQGRTIRVIIPFSAGGGTDTFARYVAQFLGHHIPGNPTVVAENVTGAGGLRGSNEFAERAARDGTQLLAASGHLNLRAFLGLQGLRLRLDGLEPVIAAPMGHITSLNVRASGVRNARDFLQLRGRITKGITDPIGVIESIVALEMFEMNYRAVPGFAGRGDTRLAFERGELMITTQATPAHLARVRPMVQAGEAIELYAIGFVNPQGNPVRDPAARDIITAPELYREIHGRMPQGQVWEAYKVVANLVQNTRGVLWVHADAPAEARAALTAGVNAMVRDTTFLAAGARVMEGYDIISGPGLGQIKADLATASPAVLAWLRNMLTTKFNVRFES